MSYTQTDEGSGRFDSQDTISWTFVYNEDWGEALKSKSHSLLGPIIQFLQVNSSLSFII